MYIANNASPSPTTKGTDKAISEAQALLHGEETMTFRDRRCWAEVSRSVMDRLTKRVKLPWVHIATGNLKVCC